jgi:hypothetical protein
MEILDVFNLPAAPGQHVRYKCKGSKRFVSGGTSPISTCRSDGYWNVSRPYYLFTGI